MSKYRSIFTFEKSCNLISIIIVFFLSYYFFNFIWDNLKTDLTIHASFVQEIHDGIRAYPANFLYYLTINLLSFFNPSNLKFATIVTLSLALLFKFLITKNILRELLPFTKEKDIVINLIAFSLLIIIGLPTFPFIFSNFLYIGSYSANVWHNSTTIFAMPFVLLLFWQSYKQILEYKFVRLFYILLLIILNILIKPSFLFAIIVVYPLLLLLVFKFSKSFWINLITLTFTFIRIFNYLQNQKCYG